MYENISKYEKTYTCFKLMFLTKKFKERKPCDTPENFFFNAMSTNIKTQYIFNLIKY
jgi:hypothetical protein